jgi:hypothetical protein
MMVKRKTTKRIVSKTAKRLRPKKLAVKLPVPGKSGARLNVDQRAMLVALLASGAAESGIQQYFVVAKWGKLSSSTISFYRKQFADLIEAAKLQRVDDALTAGLALKAERIAALKEHAAMLEALRFVSDNNGRLWNERAWRLTLADIAMEMGERKPKDSPQELPIKVYLGIDPARV